MPAEILRDRGEIERFLREDVTLNIYAIGDLDDFYWPHTRWYGRRGAAGLAAVILLYTAFDPPILLLTASPHRADAARQLFTEIVPLLPPRVYAHISESLLETVQHSHHLQSHGLHYKMSLQNRRALDAYPPGETERATTEDAAALAQLFAQSYPDNAFDPRMLETGQFFLIRENSAIRSLAGIHVYSPQYRVAALGNIVTHPDYRGRGLGTRVTASVCRSVLAAVDHVGLNVRADNTTAIHSYQRLGFEIHAPYLEATLTLKN